jgi:hypothetical protein
MKDKLSEGFNFKLIKHYDVAELVDIVSKFNTEWKLDTSRQSQKNGAHQNTNTYYVKSFSTSWMEGDKLTVFPLANNVQVLKIVNKICDDLEKIHNGKCAIAMIVKLLPDSDIDPHQDDTEYLGLTRRHHIPLQTNSNVFFHVGSEKINMKVGECWEINNSKVHFVENNSIEDRVHLIIDIMPNHFIGGK